MRDCDTGALAGATTEMTVPGARRDSTNLVPSTAGIKDGDAARGMGTVLRPDAEVSGRQQRRPPDSRQHVASIALFMNGGALAG